MRAPVALAVPLSATTLPLLCAPCLSLLLLLFRFLRPLLRPLLSPCQPGSGARPSPYLPVPPRPRGGGLFDIPKKISHASHARSHARSHADPAYIPRTSPRKSVRIPGCPSFMYADPELTAPARRAVEPPHQRTPNGHLTDFPLNGQTRPSSRGAVMANAGSMVRRRCERMRPGRSTLPLCQSPCGIGPELVDRDLVSAVRSG